MGEYLIVEANERDRAQARKLFETVYERQPGPDSVDCSVLGRFEQAMSNYRAEMEHGFAENSRFTTEYMNRREQEMAVIRKLTTEELALRVYNDEVLREKLSLVTAKFLEKWLPEPDPGPSFDECLEEARTLIENALFEIAEGKGSGTT
jgi:hypothetical protein